MGLDAWIVVSKEFDLDPRCTNEPVVAKGLLILAVEDAPGALKAYPEMTDVKVTLPVAYWRKDWEIHRRLHKAGEDGCLSYVNRSELEDILAEAKSGSFYGWGDDNWRAESTIEQLERFLTDERWKHWDIRYSASW